MRMKTVLILPVALAASLIGAAVDPPSVIQAAKNRDKEALRALIQKKADVNQAEADGATALHWASYHDDLNSADLLIHAGAKVNAANDLGATPLWAASENGSSAMVRKLLDAGANPNLALLSGETPLMVAARGGFPDVVEILANKDANVNAHGSRGQTALMWAVAQKHPEVVKVLLAHGVNVQAKSDVWSEVMAVPPHGYLPYNKSIPHGGETALMFASRVGDLASAKLLVDAGANVNDADAWGVSATVLAEHSGYGEIATYLLDKGADPNKAEAGFTALDVAIMRGDDKTVSALLEHGADANAPLKTWTPIRRSSHDWYFSPALIGATPFWLAARFNEPEVMRMLVKHGADPKTVLKSDYMTGRNNHRKEETTAMMAAMGMGGGVAWVPIPKAERESLALESAKIAAELGVDVNAANTDGRTALDAAQALKYQTVAQFLNDKGARASGKPAPKEVPVD